MSYQQLAEELSLLPDYLGHHVVLTVAALMAGIAVCVPVGCLVSKVRPLQWPVLAFVNVVQTIPSIALLALMVLLLGQIGFLPAFIALFLYSMLPILRNTITGILTVDPAVTEAARAVGMTSSQMLFEIELPLALPVIIAGIRTSAVWVVGTATLATPVGATSLGNYIFSGLQTQNTTSVVVGCVAAAALAVALDQLVRMVEISAEKRNRKLGITAVATLMLLFTAAVAPLVVSYQATNTLQPIVIGAKTFTEQYILSEFLAQKLRHAGISVVPRASLGSVILFDALATGSVDCYVDYSGTLWMNVLKRHDLPPRPRMLQELTRALKEKYGVIMLGNLGFENNYALAMREEDSQNFHVQTIAELAPLAQRLSIGSDYEFFARPEWTTLCKAYSLKFAVQQTLDPSLMYKAVREKKVDVVSAYSTDGRLVDYHLTVLADPLQALPPYDAVLLLSRNAAHRKEVVDALRPQTGRISNQLMREANRLVDVERRSIPEAAVFLAKGIDTTSNSRQ
jgi:osmoprotectant transport system permease protein